MSAEEQYRVVITGATGAIGGALALEYAEKGVQLILQGRQEGRLQSLADECRLKGACVELCVLDLSDRAALKVWIDQLESTGVPDLLIACAGVNCNTGPDRAGECWEQAQALLELNILSTLMLTHHVAQLMRVRRSGQIVLISSLAAGFGLPVTPSYSASKAAVKAYGEALRGGLASSGVGVTVVMPGYVSSDMCDAMPGPKPFLWAPAKAAKVIRKGVERNRPRISFPFPLNWGCWWLSVLPAAVSHRIVRWLGY
ncbi:MULTISPECIES: SDR family NAD(P)-dependent oxidoreductase [Nitrincola]|uniref:3-oxoacyl-[acyl-carrier-protein] reductase FabG n=1 Tax=Nitrincola nitratireducens TaxID=1229521 RepID=W9V0X7_9GAMM|nr:MULTISPECIES: SDR family NAD(P)-dependent oxidoreductase [Nitrincola]EXJ10611.1 3-oxoacyl-[acyl-carrier-protein] reductase FabG [Nitrincola nitratireducens]